MEVLAQRIEIGQLTGHDLTGMLMFVLTFLGLMIALFITSWFGYREKCLNAALKRDMIARGYSAKEILAVIGAETGKKAVEEKDELPDVPPAKPVKPVASFR
jgi:hypothetical protein